jgi:uncharacterized membrane protein YkgB
METRTSNSDSVVNTLLIIVILLVIAGFIAWWFGMYNGTMDDDNNTIDTTIELPTTPDTGTIDTNPPPSAP